MSGFGRAMSHSWARRVFVAGASALVATLITQVAVGAQDQRGRLAVSAVSLTALRAWDAAIDRQLRTGDLRVYRTRTNAFLPGRRSERIAQYHQGVPVYGADLTRQTAGGVTTSVFGTQYIGIDLDTTSGLPVETARAVFNALAGPAFGLADTPTLWVLPTGDGRYALTWRGRLTDMRTLFIDAGSGELRFERSDTRTQSSVGLGTGLLEDQKKMVTERRGGVFLTRDLLRPAELRTLDMDFDLFHAFDRLGGVVFGDAPTSDQDLAADTDNRWNDGTVVDVHAAMGFTYDYLATQLGWAGIDGNDGAVDALVHPFDSQAALDLYYECFLETGVLSEDECDIVSFMFGFRDNAAYFWPGFPGSTGALMFGAPFLGLLPLTNLESVAHEMGHGVGFFTAALMGTEPPNEPGALSEGFADVIGTAVEFYVHEPGDGPLRADYLIGEDAGPPIRSLRDPREVSLSRDEGDFLFPDHYDDLYRGPFDNGGVHLNSTILGHLYYLAVEGGTNRTSGLAVQGVGGDNRLQIERIFFNAWAHLLPSFATFSIAADSLIQSAVELYGPSHPATTAIAQAIAAVGIPSTTTCHDTETCR